MNAAKTFRTFNVLAIVATMLALFALALAPAGHASAASIAPSGSGLTISPVKDSQAIAVGQTAYHTYVLSNMSAVPLKVQLAAKNDQGWPVSLSATQVEVPANSSVKFEVKLFVPPTASTQSLTVVAAVTAATSPLYAYWSVQPILSTLPGTPGPITVAPAN